LYKNRKETAIYTKREKVHKTLQKRRIHKVENKYTKQENKHTKNIKKKRKSSN